MKINSLISNFERLLMDEITAETAGKMLDVICDRIEEIDILVERVKHSSHTTMTSNINSSKKRELLNEYNILMLELYDELQKLESAHEVLINLVKKDFDDSVC